MLKKIQVQIDEFTQTIKEEKGCDEMLSYLNGSFIASIKLLMFASTIFSLYARMMIFFLIASGGLLLSSIIGAIPASSSFFLATTLSLFIVIMVYVMQCRKMLHVSIEKTKSSMQQDTQST